MYLLLICIQVMQLIFTVLVPISPGCCWKKKIQPENTQKEKKTKD